MRYRRARVKGATYFFTVVTFNRRKILTQSENVKILREAFRYVMASHPFKIDAFVLLPDHIHCIWTLPPDDGDFSRRWRMVKSYFTRKCSPEFKAPATKSRRHKGEQAIWQRRFWEHLIRDREDLRKHVEYIHYNPVKHGLVGAPRDWEYSSFHRYVRKGVYERGWGAGQEIRFEEIMAGE
jgi:REP-associated tyrosine transposase